VVYFAEDIILYISEQQDNYFENYSLAQNSEQQVLYAYNLENN
jgi:hypothetical protein